MFKLNQEKRKMINPNKKHKVTGKITKLIRDDYYKSGFRDLEVTLDNGQVLEGTSTCSHKTIELGDVVECVIGFRITSDRYVVESIKRPRQAKNNWRAVDNFNSSFFNR